MFDSGFGYFNPLDQAGVINQALSFLVRDSEPSWFYCKQEQPVFHCEAGMVFGINVGDKMGAFLATSRPGGLSTSMLVGPLARQLSHFWTLLTYLIFLQVFSHLIEPWIEGSIGTLERCVLLTVTVRHCSKSNECSVSSWLSTTRRERSKRRLQPPQGPHPAQADQSVVVPLDSGRTDLLPSESITVSRH